MNRTWYPARAVAMGRWLLTVVSLWILVIPAVSLVPTSIRHPWDLKTYCVASRAAAQGQDPYDADVLSRVAGGAVGMPFLYPPITLPLLTPLASLPIDTMSQVWSWINVLLLTTLVLLWRRYFLPDVPGVLLALVAVFGFNAASVWAIRSGNIVTLELLLLWAGFAAYTRERRLAFALCVVTASLFKMVPGAFLALLLVPSRERMASWRLAVGAAALLAGLVLVPALAGPSWARGFFHPAVVAERPHGVVNPSALGIIDTILGDFVTPLSRPPFTALGILLVWDAILIAISVPTLRRLWCRRDPREWVLASTILYALLVPRMMVYSYLLVLVPALAIASPVLARFGGRWLVAGVLVAHALWNVSRSLFMLQAPPELVGRAGILRENLSFLILLGIWLAHVAAAGRSYKTLFRPRRPAESPASSSPIRKSKKGDPRRRTVRIPV